MVITHAETISETELTGFSFFVDGTESKDAELFYFGIQCGWWYLLSHLTKNCILDIIPANIKLFMITWEKCVFVFFFTMHIAFVDFR